MQISEILDNLKTLVETATTEAQLQAFLETYPFLVGENSSHLVRSVVISQLPLGPDFRADFAYITHSFTGGTWLHLVEIERPDMSIFVRSDEFSQEYNHAFQQLHDWAFWCVANQDSIAHTLEPLFTMRRGFGTHCKLIAGRRTDVSNAKRERQFAAKVQQLPKEVEVATWDGFVERLEHLRAAPIETLGRVRCVAYKNQDYFPRAL